MDEPQTAILGSLMSSLETGNTDKMTLVYLSIERIVMYGIVFIHGLLTKIR